MIIGADELAPLRGKVTMVDGGFDPIHIGHVMYFRAAAALGLPVLCSVSPDAYVATKHRVLLPHAERCQVIDEFRSISFVHPAQVSTAEMLELVRPRIYAKGVDWEGRLPARELAICSQYDISIVYTDTSLGSSSRMIADFDRSAPESLPPG